MPKNTIDKTLDALCPDQPMTNHPARLRRHAKRVIYQDLLDMQAEYMDCKEDSEKNWQNCTCDTAKAIPVEALKQYFGKE